MRSLDIAATGMLGQQQHVDVIANNIANLSTTAYKKRNLEFQDLLYQSNTRVGAASTDSGTIVPTGVQFGLGVRAASTYAINIQGSVAETGNNLDVAIDGKGYFQINLPDGEPAYTRAGSFQLSPDGEIVNSQGFTVSPGISVPNNATDITINESGEVLASIDGQTTLQNLGQLDLVTFINEAGLEATGNNLLLETEASGAPTSGFAGTDGFGNILHKFLENSNVDAVSELTDLIEAQRAYELGARVLNTVDELMQALNR